MKGYGCFPDLFRIPAGGTERVEVFVVPLQMGSGVAYPAKVTYKTEPDAASEQVRCQYPTSRCQLLSICTVLLAAGTCDAPWRPLVKEMYAIPSIDTMLPSLHLTLCSRRPGRVCGSLFRHRWPTRRPWA